MTSIELLDDTYKHYIEKVKLNIVELESIKTKVEIDLDFYKNLCIENRPYVSTNNNIYHKICNKIDTLTYEEIKVLNKRLHDYNKRLWTIDEDIISTSVLKIYVNNVESNLKLYQEVIGKLEVQNAKLIDRSLFRILYKELYRYKGHMILQGYPMTIGDKYRMRIVLKYNNYISGNQHVDKEASRQLLMRIANRVRPDLLKRFKEKDLTYSQFIDKMKPYVYNHEHPDRPKWILFITKDISPWLIMTRQYSSCPNKRMYSIDPYSFKHMSIATNDKLLSMVKSTDDIIKHRRIGFQDKLHCLELFDMEFCKRRWELIDNRDKF